MDDARAGRVDVEREPKSRRALRLVLGTRLDVGDDEPPSFDPSDPRAHKLAVYLYLSSLQEQLLEAMAGAL